MKIVTTNPTASKEKYFVKLTISEIEILKYICNGLSNKEISDKRVTSTRTVDTQVRSIFNKLNVNNRMELFAVSIQSGLLTFEDVEIRPTFELVK